MAAYGPCAWTKHIHSIFQVPLPLKAGADVNGGINRCFSENTILRAVNNMDSLHESVRSDDLKSVKKLLQNNPDHINSKDNMGETPLHSASGSGHKAMAELLLANKADVNARDNNGNTPLLWAATYGHKAVAKLLLANRADVNARDNFGNTALQRAEANGHKAVVKLLRRYDANVANHIVQPISELMRILLVSLFIIGIFFISTIGINLVKKHTVSPQLCFILGVIIVFCVTLISVIMARKKKRNAVVNYFLDRSITAAYIQNAREFPGKNIINAILCEKSIPTASESLLIWGAINLLTWFVQYGKIIELLRRINALNGTFSFFYGGCVIAVCMLVFGVFGQVTKITLVGYLNGIVLVTVGLWNLNFDNMLDNAVRASGYTLIEKGFNIFDIVALLQCFWGLLQIFNFWRFGFQPGINKAVKDGALPKLQEITRSPAKPDIGRFKFTMPASLFQSFIPGIRHGGSYTVWLLPYKACCLHDKLEDYFEYDRRAVAGHQFNETVEYLMNGDIKIRLDTRLIKFKDNCMVLNDSALKSFNEWLKIE